MLLINDAERRQNTAGADIDRIGQQKIDIELLNREFTAIRAVIAVGYKSMLELRLGRQLDPVVKVVAHIHHEPMDIKLVVASLLKVGVDFSIAAQVELAGLSLKKRKVALLVLQVFNFCVHNRQLLFEGLNAVVIHCAGSTGHHLH